MPLSFAQQRLWFLCQLLPSSPAYNNPVAARLTGRLDVAALQRALDTIVARHEALRTTVAAVDGRPIQVIAEPRPVELTLLDVTAHPHDQREALARRWLDGEARRPFDLTRDLMMRAGLVRLDPEEHIALLILHHIASDGWSMHVLYRELAALYEAFATGVPSPLVALPIQYADFAIWQRRHLEGQRLESLLAYWRGRLGGPLPLLEVPADYPRPPQPTLLGGRESVDLSPAVREALTALGRRHAATLFMTLLALFSTWLFRYTDEEDLIVGAPSAGRTPETDSLIGFFANTLALRIDLSGNPRFSELLGRVRHSTLEAYAHQDLPFERLVEELRPTRDRGFQPLVRVMFGFQSARALDFGLPSLVAQPVAVDTGTTKVDLTLWLIERAGGLGGYVEYSRDLFEPASIQRMLEHFGRLVEGVIAAPDTRLADLPFLTDAEHRRIVVEWNATATAYPADHGIPELFQAQVERAPDAVAVTDGPRSLTYRELSTEATSLASVLRERGVAPDVVVGVCLDRSLELIVALLAVLEAGGAYLPLDPSYPEERLRFMCEDARAAVVLTDGRGAGWLPEPGPPVVCVDERGTAPATRTVRSEVGVTADSLAYVIYTSGSTGVPKGVAVPHRAVARLVKSADYIVLGPGDAVGQASTCSFDAATFEIWGALLNGARLVIVPKDVSLSPAELGAAIDRERITTLFLSTALFNEIARLAPSSFAGLGTLLFGGEAVEPRWVREVLRHGPPARLLHVYGPTEATTFASWYPVLSVADDAQTIPIGRPIGNTTLYVLDRYLNPLPIGVPGELHVGGPGVARGYIDRPALTAERFIPDPFNAVPGARLYRTGDLVRYRPDGDIEFLGRRDGQVKIRGFRVEPGEVEAVLASAPGVRQACVVAREDEPGQRRLVAYLVMEGPQEAITAVRSFLRARLPDYMIPGGFVVLDRLPLSPTGKVDRGALPPPTAAAALPGYVPAWSALEHQLVHIWEELLGIHPIGVTDDFFELGGHSLLAARMMVEVERACGKRLPLSTLFSGATIERLALALVADEGPQPAELVPIRTTGSAAPLFLLHGDIEGGGFYCTALARKLPADRPFYAVAPVELPDGGSLPTIEAMAAHHVSIVRGSRPQGPYLLAGYCNGALIALEMARQLRAAGADVPVVALLAPPPVLPVVVRVAQRVGRTASSVERGLRLRRALLRLAELLQYYRRRLAELRRAGVAEQVRFVLGKAIGAAQIVGRGRPSAMGSGPQEQSIDVGADFLAARGRLMDERHRRIWEAYFRAVEYYVPRWYPGRIAVLQPEETLRHAEDPSRGWRRLAATVRVDVLPGNHITAITRHLAVVAERLEAALREASRPAATRRPPM